MNSDDVKEIVTQKQKEKFKKLEEAAMPLIKYLNELYHPHVTAIVTPTSVEILSGEMSIPKIYNHLKD